MTAIGFARVLLIEDEGLTRTAMRRLILAVQPEMTIEEAGSFEEATLRLENSPYDLVFLDYRLGGERTGLDVLRWISERGLGIHTVMLSAQDDRATVLECIKEGACGFVSKSSDGGGDVFREAIDTILAGRVYLPSNVLGKGGQSPPPAGTPTRGVQIESLDLPPRLTQALRYLLQGMSNKAIARKMDISENTAKEYAGELLVRFNVTRRTFLIVELARRGIEIPSDA